jgi:hypothetical protein
VLLDLDDDRRTFRAAVRSWAWRDLRQFRIALISNEMARNNLAESLGLPGRTREGAVNLGWWLERTCWEHPDNTAVVDADGTAVTYR